MIDKHLRSTCASFKRVEIDKMIRQNNFNYPYDKITGTFQSKFEVKTVNGKKVVIDGNFALMWQQSGERVEISPKYRLMGKMHAIDSSIINSLSCKEAKKYIDQLNSENYAGYSDWRLPTLEELMSLMKATKGKNELYLSEEFDAEQDWCWSCDRLQNGEELLYGVDFRYGSIDADCLDFDTFSRGLRSN